jgi:hypothetical protein
MPGHIKLHLFDVRGGAIGALAGHPRIHPVGSQAWDYSARPGKWRDGENFNVGYRAARKRRWHAARTSALGLFAKVEHLTSRLYFYIR